MEFFKEGGINIMLEKQFLEFVKKMTCYNEAIHLMYWDLRTGAPKNAVEQRSEVIGMLSSEVFKMSTSEEMAAFIAHLLSNDTKTQLSEITRKTLEECKKTYEKNKKIPVDEYKEYIILQSKAEAIWEDAKENSDFPMLQPYLEKIIEYKKRFIEYWGYEGNKYNALLDLYEPGVTVELLDEVFAKLRERIVPLVKEITEAPNKPNTSFIYEFFPKEKQRELSIVLLKQLGYDFDSGRLDETAHPFAIGLNPGDVRVTTKYDEYDFRTAIFGTLHEGGHAIYEQNISKELIGTPLCTGTSMGIHESQSLFYENFIGRNRHYWLHNFPLLKQYSNGQFNKLTVEDFYRAINESKPSLIRIEADELTYPLHIIIRYEIEKALINDEIQVKDLPEVWNAKYEEYLGIRPENDAKGVLQDVHWAGGDFGYFPSYALGYMYAAQFQQAMLKDLPNFSELLEKGILLPIKHWLNEKIHRHGKMKKPLEILEEVTGEGLNPDHLISYLENKYRDIYGLS
jgi:carboxypeptidase Taq